MNSMKATGAVAFCLRPSRKDLRCLLFSQDVASNDLKVHYKAVSL
jgi:hypothetical protein